MSFCYGCGMPVGADDEYHPHAACLMYRATENAAEVLDNLRAVEEHGATAERAAIRLALEAERDGPGLDWSDVDQVQAMIDRVCPAPEGGSREP